MTILLSKKIKNCVDILAVSNNLFEYYGRGISEIKRGGSYKAVVITFKPSKENEYQASI